MSKLQNIRYKQVRPQANSTGSSFSGEIDFQFNVANNEVFVPSETYINVVVDLYQSGLANAVEILAPANGVSASPLTCLFTNGSVSCNNRELCKVSELAQTGHIYNKLYMSHGDALASTVPINENIRFGNNESYVKNLDDAVKARKALLGIADAATPAYNKHRFEMCQRLPLLITNDECSGNTNWHYKLQVENNWRNQLLERSAAFNGPILDTSTPSTASGSMKLDVVDIYLNVSLFEVDEVPRSVSSTIAYKELFSTTRNIPESGGSASFTITMPKNISSVFFCMFDSRRLSDPALSPSAFNCAATKVLKSYEIRYGKSVFPSPSYNLNLTDETDSLESRDRSGNMRAFREFLYSTRELVRGEGASSFDSLTWGSSPIFYHRVIRPVGDTSNDLDLNLVFSDNAHANSILYVGAIFSKTATINYNEVGLVAEVIPAETL